MVSRSASLGAMSTACSSGTNRPVASSRPTLTSSATASTSPEPHRPFGSTSPITPSSTSSPIRIDLDRPVRGPHPAPDRAALEGRPGRRRGDDDPVAVAHDDLAVGADVDEEPGPLVAVHPGRQHAGDDVAADVGTERGEEERAGARVEVEPDLGGQHHRWLRGGHHERRDAERLRIDAQHERGHGGVAGDRDLVDLPWIDATFGADLRRQLGQAWRPRPAGGGAVPPGPSSSR